MTKVCRDCKLEKTTSEFYAKSSNKDNLRSECKVCTNIRNKARLDSRTIWNKIAEEDKGCTECKVTKPYTSYYHCKTSTDGLRGSCRECIKSALRKKSYKVSVETKSCSKCEVEKPSSQFAKARRSSDGLRPDCRECSNKSSLIHRSIHKGRLAEENRAYREANPHVCSAISGRRRKLLNQPINRAYLPRIKELYYLRDAVIESSGIEHNIDHIIPLKNREVCGLNVPWNMQVLTKSENLCKSNKFDGTYENESWRE